jgi:polysaccharide biosynthesis protein PslH
MNILFVTQNYPYPGVLHGGGQDFWRLIDFLRESHRIYVITLDDPVQPVPRSALAPYVEKLAIIRYARTPTEKIIAVASAVLRGYHHPAIGRRYWEARGLVRDWVARYRIDVLHCGWTEMGVCLTAPDRPVVRVLDEVEVRFLADQSAVGGGALSTAQADQRKQQELAYCTQADLIVTRADHDLAILREYLPTLNGFVLPPAGNIDDFLSISPDDAEPYELLFCGALNRAANVEGLQWFIESVWPVVREAVPDARLNIVGAHPWPAVIALGSQPGISVVGYAPDLRAWYSRAQVIIAPIFVTGGSQNKVRDGLAAGRPVVGTSIANKGVNAPCVQVADAPGNFTNHIIKLLLDHSHWSAVSDASRRFAQDNFHWQVSAAALEANYDELSQKLPGKR